MVALPGKVSALDPVVIWQMKAAVVQSTGVRSERRSSAVLGDTRAVSGAVSTGESPGEVLNSKFQCEARTY